MAAPAAPAVGGAALLTGAIIIQAFAWIVLFGLLYTYNYTFGALLKSLANILSFGVSRFKVDLSGPVRALDDTINNLIGDGLRTVEAGINHTLHGFEWLIRQSVDTFWAFAHETHDAFERLVNGTIPAAVGAATLPVTRQLDALRKATRAMVDAELLRFARGIDSLKRDLHAEQLARLHGIDQLAGTLAARLGQLAHVLTGEVAALGGYVRGKVNVRIGRLESLVLGTALTAAVVGTLTRYLPWFRCTNVNRFNRALCRFPVRELEGLLAGTLALAIALDPQALARVATEVTETLEDVIRATALD